MPPLPVIPAPVLRSLELQLRHAPRETLLRDVERTEALARDIDPTIQYPHEWIIFRVTGFRPDNAPPGTVTGKDLLASLSPFAEVLCVRARLRSSELPDGAFVRASTLEREWSASAATLKRWRRAGLVTRRALGDAGREEVWVSRLCAEHFRAAHAPSLARAQKSVRRTPAERDDIVAQALALRARGLSTHAAARSIAQSTSRSVEGVRHILQIDPRTSGLFARPRRTAADPGRRRGALLRLWRAGADPVDLAKLAHKSVPLTRREISIARAAMLQAWRDSGALDVPDEVAGDAQAASSVPVPTHAPLPLTLQPRPLAELLADWRSRTPLPRAHEHGLANAYHALRTHAAAITTGLNRLHPSAHALDEAETALRHASVIRAVLVHSQHRLIVETIETRAALPLDRLLPVLTVRLLRDAIATASIALNHFDPSKGGRLAGPVGLAVDKASVRTLRDALPPKASTRAMVLQPEVTITLPPLSPWDRALLPDPRIVSAARDPRARAADPDLALLADRFGLAGSPPQTLRQLREARGLTEIAVAHAVQRALARRLRNNPA